MWSVDFSNAYKTIGINKESEEAAHICFINPTNNRPYKARVLVQPFGSRRAPANWGRVVTFLQFVAGEILRVTTGAFVDDVFCVESHRIAMSGFWAFKQLRLLIGSPTSDKKDQPPSTEAVLLGADVSIRETHAQSQISDERKGRIKSFIRIALESNTSTPASSSKLRGKLGFYSSLLAWNLGRGMMGPLIARQYQQRGSALSPDLRNNLLWRYSALGNLAPRTAPLGQLRPLGAHTDAQGHGQVATVFHHEGRHAAHLNLPERFCLLANAAGGESPIFL